MGFRIGGERDKISGLLFEKLAFASGTPKEFNINNPGFQSGERNKRIVRPVV